jgi:hypothetical protein
MGTSIDLPIGALWNYYPLEFGIGARFCALLQGAFEAREALLAGIAAMEEQRFGTAFAQFTAAMDPRRDPWGDVLAEVWGLEKQDLRC